MEIILIFLITIYIRTLHPEIKAEILRMRQNRSLEKHRIVQSKMDYYIKELRMKQAGPAMGSILWNTVECGIDANSRRWCMENMGVGALAYILHHVRTYVSVHTAERIWREVDNCVRTNIIHTL